MAVIQRSEYLRNYLAVTGSYIQAMDGAKLYCYNGSMPTTPNSSLGAVTLVVTITNDGTSTGLTFQAATPTNDGSVYKKTTETWKGTVSNSSDLSIDFARLVNGANVLMQMPAVTTGEGLRMAERTPVDAADQPINGFQYIHATGSIVQEALALRQYLVATGSYKDKLDGGKLFIYDGTPPASVEDALSGNNLIATITNSSTSTGLTFESTASDGILAKKATETWSGVVSNSGAEVATFWRFKDSGGNVMLQGGINYAAGFVLEDAAPVDGSTLVIRRFAYSIPE